MFRHKFDPSSLVAALLFLNIAGAYLNQGFGGTPVSYTWVIPTGIAVVVALRLIFRSRRRER